MSQEQSERDNLVSESYKELLDHIGGDSMTSTSLQVTVAKLGMKMAWELTEAVKEFSRSTQRLGKINMYLTGVIATATLVYAAVELYKLFR